MKIFNSIHYNKNQIILILSIFLVVVGVGLRFYHITRDDFVFYDEGFYLNHNRLLGDLLEKSYPTNFSDLMKALGVFTKLAMASGKTLWFLLADARFFFGGLKLWALPRVLSAILGSLTLWVAFRFAKKFYESKEVAWLTVGLLAVLPSHVFYSRIGMQEALSTILVLAGFYFYVFSRRAGLRTIISGLFFGAAFFSNYRLIILPVLVGFCELWLGILAERKINFRKYLWFLLTFLSCVFFVGNLHDAANTVVIFSWIFHQSHLAEQQWSWINLLSYPYYLFRLDGVLLASAFFSASYFIFKREWRVSFPFAIAFLQMLIFSFAGDKGARYICVVFPFVAMAAAYTMIYFIRRVNEVRLTIFSLVFILLMSGFLLKKAVAIATIDSDYKESAEFVMAKDRDVKFLSTQNYVQNLYTPNPKNVQPCPHNFNELANYYAKGFRYFIVGPQGYISWAKNNKKFTPELEGYLSFVSDRIPPVKTFPHFSYTMLERFVFEHSENLDRSIKFLNIARKEDFGKLKVYDLSQTINIVLYALSQQPMQ